MLPNHTFGMGDRFGREGVAQLRAVQRASVDGVAVAPVWNKSHREHSIIGSRPEDLRAEADAAVAELGWTAPYFVDADHINARTVDAFLGASDFFTLDVADFIGREAPREAVEDFVRRRAGLIGEWSLPGLQEPLRIGKDDLQSAAGTFLWAVQEAGRLHRHIAARKEGAAFAVEVSMDETERPQTPVELLLILAMIAEEGIPVETIAPKFSGRFNKGVDYVGDLAQFSLEFSQDLAVLAHARREFGLPASLKLSVHSGSDKFSLYPIINGLIKRHGAGLHVKTAGTTWLEELIGLAEAGGEALDLAKEIYREALPRFDELIRPYATVVDILPGALPSVATVDAWDSAHYAGALRHDPTCPAYNPHFRQFLHVAFKIAAKLGTRFTGALEANREAIAPNVTANLLDRHIRPIFG